MRNKIISVLLCFCLCLTFTFAPASEAHAIIPLIVGEEVIAVCAGLLTAAGIQFITTDAAKAAGYRFYTNMKQDYRDMVSAAAGAAGALAVTAGLWDSTKNEAASFTDGNVDVPLSGSGAGSVTYPATVTSHAPTGFGLYGTATFSNIKMRYYGKIEFYNSANDFSFGSIAGNWTGSMTEIRFYNHVGEPSVILKTWNDNGSETLPYAITFVASTDSSKVYYGDTLIYTYPTVKTLPHNMTYGTCGFVYTSTSVATLGLQQGTNYTTVNNYYNNPANDYSNKNVTAPTTLGGVVSGTPADVLTDSGTTVVAPPTTDTGILQDMWQTLKNILAKLALAAGALLALPTTIGDSLTDWWTTPAEEGVNWEPLKVSGSLFTTRFPFSIPWDVYNSVTAFGSGDNTAPRWEIVLPSPLTGTLVIDLALFDTIVPAVRAMELFVFTLGLAVATRKLLGGDV